MEILSRPIDGNLSMPETEIQILAKAALKSALVGLPAGLACYFTCYAFAMLKQLARRYDMPVIAASSLNREAYRPGSAEPGLSAFKESGSVEYSADLLLVLKYRTDADKEIKTGPRHLALTILKNRFGATGESIPLDYEPEKELFRDAAAKAAPRTGRNIIR